MYVVTTYRAEITSLISETVAGWDADQTSKKIEAHIGRDLQFIRSTARWWARWRAWRSTRCRTRWGLRGHRGLGDFGGLRA